MSTSCFFSPGCPLNRHNSAAGQYAQACVQAAGQCGADVLDLWTLMQKDEQVGGACHCTVQSLRGHFSEQSSHTPQVILCVYCIDLNVTRHNTTFFHYLSLNSSLNKNLLTSFLYSALQDYTVYLSDGLHLSARGNQFVAQHLWGLLESRVADLPFILPYWGDVDAKDPESSLLCDQWRHQRTLYRDQNTQRLSVALNWKRTLMQLWFVYVECKSVS